MYLKQSDLFVGLGHNFLKDTMAIAERISLAKGEFVFRPTEPATHFYILIDGQITLLRGDPGEMVYVSSGAGEIFGCSCLLGHDCYVFSAKCETPAVLLKIDQQKMATILDADTESGYQFYKKLAGAIGYRLRQMYNSNAAEKQVVATD